MVQKIKVTSKNKIGFVCSGGATKAGAFHLGVALALQEHGFKFLGGLKSTHLNTSLGSPHSTSPSSNEISTYVGSSAGSMITTYLANGYSLENIFNSFLDREPSDPKDALPRILPKLSYQKLFKVRAEGALEQMSQFSVAKDILSGVLKGNFDAIMQLKWIKTAGLFTTAGLEEFIREQVVVSNQFKDLAADLFIVATQLNHSRKVVFGKYAYQPPDHNLSCQYSNDVSISEACAASTALPFVYAPYTIEHQDPSMGVNQYIDGEIRDTMSTHVAVDSGADLVIASHTHQPYHWRQDIGSLMQYGLPNILLQSLYLVIEQKVNQYVHSKTIQNSAINAVDRYCLQEKIDPQHRDRILKILETELQQKRNVTTLYIHPDPTDAEMFFGEHFSLSPKKLTYYVKSGFKAAHLKLREYDFS